MSGVLMAGLTMGESDLLAHVSRWGSDGYPIQKCRGGRWIWTEMFGIKGAPVVYKTKREVTQAIENYLDVLRDRHGEAVRAAEDAAANGSSPRQGPPHKPSTARSGEP